ncbi:MAG: HAMP domain-containing histidine kinase [Gemmataceae bacterium]|nr:HAMP domain-containing histidine kinase [Gemmataceae bacterium]
MLPTGPGEQAGLLPWFWPDAASFAACAAVGGSHSWSDLRNDPGLLLYLLSRDIPFQVHSGCASDGKLKTLLASPSVPWVDWRSPEILPATRTALAAAHFAEILAKNFVGIEPAQAWTGAWLAFTGCLAVGVVEPRAINEYLADPSLHTDPFGTQIRLWGSTRADIAWRLSNEWRLPRWAQILLGRIDVTPELAHQMGGDRRLHAVVQVAVILAEQAETRFFVSDEFDLASGLAELQIRSTDLEQVRRCYAAECDLNAWLNLERSDPRSGLRLLDLADAVEDMSIKPIRESDAFQERVKEAKLAALAELAAGAGHEINNPLAIISGHGQYLMRDETDDAKKQALQSIIRQTRRIHSVLTELMYFARPPELHKEWIELSRLVRESIAVVAPLAAERNIEIELEAMSTPLWVDVDPKQLTVALSALIRNSVEASPAGGWVRVASVFRSDRLDVVVEDSGPGLDERAREHLFDPFFSGREAGRGRGLGLSAAWRLARQHGGDVHFVPVDDGPTRFVLTLPATVAVTAAQRKSA